MLRYLLVLFSLATIASSGIASTTDELFSPARPADIPLPATRQVGSGFVKMDESRFARLASGEDFTCTIRNFPLGTSGSVDLRVEQFDVVSRSVRGDIVVPPHVFFRGFVEGASGSHVFLALFADQAFGYIVRNGVTYAISAAGPAKEGSLILGSSIDSTKMEGFACGNFGKNEVLSESVRNTIAGIRSRQASAAPADVVRLITVALELDHPFVIARGGTAAAALSYALSVLAAASDVYTRDAGIALECTYHTEFSNSDPYTATTACDLLWEISPKVLTDQPMLWVTMSGRHTDWCGGIADGIGVLCAEAPSPHCVCGISGGVKSWDYPYKTFVWDIMVTAHETGHLVACPHTHNCFWDPPIDSCVESEGDCYFGTYPSRGTIMSYCHTTSAGANLVFHPLCSALMMDEVDRKACATPFILPTVNFAPSKTIAECAGGQYSFSVIPDGAGNSYTLDVNPKADTVTSKGNGWTVVLNSSRYQRFYFRITDSSGNRSYDSVVFTPLPGFAMSVAIDTLTITDSAILTSTAPSTLGNVSFKWCRVGNSWTLKSGDRFVVARTATTSYYCVASTVGGCIDRDTILVTSKVAGVDRDEVQPSVHLVPNPTHSILHLVAGPPRSSCWIVDLLGRRVTSVLTSDGAGSTDFRVQDLAPGTYYVVYESDGAHGSLKFRKE